MKYANITFDAAPSARSVDENGFMHVASSHITKATVNPYYGREIPGWQKLGLDPERIYYGFRAPEELRKSISTWEGLPLHIEHHPDSAEAPEKLTRVGAVGKAVWNAPYIDAPLTVWDMEAIDAIKDGSFRELSCAYRYEPDFTPGHFEGVEYDFVMRNIRGNHVALVEEGRAGPDVIVADAALGMDADKWITVHPNGANGAGRPALIDGETGKVKAGMGGKFNGRHIDDIPRGKNPHAIPETRYWDRQRRLERYEKAGGVEEYNKKKAAKKKEAERIAQRRKDEEKAWIKIFCAIREQERLEKAEKKTPEASAPMATQSSATTQAAAQNFTALSKDAEEWKTAKNGKRYQIETETGKIAKGNVGQSEWDAPAMQSARRDKVAAALQEIANGKAESTIPGLRNDLEQYGGTNDVTVETGNSKKGLVHIVERHGEWVVPSVLEAMANGQISQFVQGNKTVHIDKDGFRAMLALEAHGKKKTWLLTGFDIVDNAGVGKPFAGDSGKVSARHASTQTGPILSRPCMGAANGFHESICKILEAIKSADLAQDADDPRNYTDKTPTNLKPNPIKGVVMRLRNWFRGARDAAPDTERQEVDLAQAIIDLHKTDPNTGEIVDVTEDEDKAAEIRKLMGELSSKLDEDEIKRLTDALTDLAYSKATGDADPDEAEGAGFGKDEDEDETKSATDAEMREAMDACGLDADDEDAATAFGEGVKYGEGLIRNPHERGRLDREHESEGMKKAMDACGLDAENPQESRAFAEGVKYGEKLERNPAERKKLDSEHEAAGMKKAIGKNEDKNEAISRILDEVPGLTSRQRSMLESRLADLAYEPTTEDEDLPAQDSALRKRGRRPLLASDAALIQARAVADAQDNMRRIAQAVRDVRPLVGELDLLAFDSANKVYGYALNQCGVKASRYSRSAWRGMVEMLLRQKSGLDTARLAQDRSPRKYQGQFKGLNNINLG